MAAQRGCAPCREMVGMPAGAWGCGRAEHRRGLLRGNAIDEHDRALAASRPRGLRLKSFDAAPGVSSDAESFADFADVVTGIVAKPIADYVRELRELRHQNAKLEKRVAQLEAKVDPPLDLRLRAIEQRLELPTTTLRVVR